MSRIGETRLLEIAVFVQFALLSLEEDFGFDFLWCQRDNLLVCLLLGELGDERLPLHYFLFGDIIWPASETHHVGEVLRLLHFRLPFVNIDLWNIRGS